MLQGQSETVARVAPSPGKSARISVELSIARLYDANRTPLGVTAIMRDVSERWQKAKETAKRLATLDAHTQSKEK